MQTLWKSLLASPVVLGATLFIGATAWAGETPVASDTAENLNQVSETTPNTSVSELLTEQSPATEIGQVTSVSQFSDVQPTDWAFQALQSLVERYGCIAGYPDGTFRGNRALTRYEFAAGLNACLDRVNELISSNPQIPVEDIATLRRLTEEFSAELATLRGRVDALEARTSELEANQFSTTTKLNGVAIFAPVSVLAGDNAIGNRIDKVPILVNRVRLNLDTSFTGKDLLRTRLQALNFDALSGTSTLTPEGDLRFGSGPFGDSGKNSVSIDALLYSFPLGDKTRVILEANAGAADDFVNTVNPYFDGDGDSGALSNFGTRNPIYYQVAGSGIGIRHQFSDSLELSLGYLAGAANNPAAGNGLFDGSYGAIGQLTIKPSQALTLGLTYVNSYNQDLTAGSNTANFRTAFLSNPVLVDNFGPIDVPVSSNSYGLQASFQLSPKFAIGGWVGYTNTRTLASFTADSTLYERGDLDIWNYAVTLAFPDLGKPGSLGGIIVGMEPKVTSVSGNLKNTLGADPDTSLHIEGFYQYKLNDNISITPGVIWLTAPDHNENNDDVVIGTVRTTFSF